LHYYLDGEAAEYTLRRIKVLINQSAASIDSEILGGEVVEVTQQLYPHPTVADVLPDGAECLNVRFNERAVRVPNPNFRVLQAGEPIELSSPLDDGAQLRRDVGGRMVVADLLPLLQRELDGDEGDEWLITVDGKFADMNTAVVASSLIEILTEDPGAGDEAQLPAPTQGVIFP
jgi:hypothetical protein